MPPHLDREGKEESPRKAERKTQEPKDAGREFMPPHLDGELGVGGEEGEGGEDVLRKHLGIAGGHRPHLQGVWEAGVAVCVWAGKWRWGGGGGGGGGGRHSG